MAINVDLNRACDILGVGSDVSSRELRRAYRAQVRKWHPDRFASDPQAQLRAEELLKGINEAFGLLQAEVERRMHAAVAEHPGLRPDPAPAEPAAAGLGPTVKRPVRSDPLSFLRLFPSLPVVTFLAAWQNVIFVLLVACTVSVSLQLHGTFFNGAGYLLKILAVPFALAVVCNLVYGGKKVLWGIYAAVVLLAGAMVTLDSVRYRNEWHEAASYRYYSAPDAGGGSYVVAPQAIEDQGQVSFPGRRAPSGPEPPVTPTVGVPAAPLAPDTPIAPMAPPAAPAR